MWVLVALACAGLVAIISIAGAGVYFVTRHIRSESATQVQATQALESVAITFASSRPLFELDSADEPRPVRPLAQVPTGLRPSRDLLMLAWEPEHQRLVKVALPFWMLRIGKHKLRIARDREGFDLERLNLDVDELERIGPAMLIDFRNPEGVRVLVWTQ